MECLDTLRRSEDVSKNFWREVFSLDHLQPRLQVLYVQSQAMDTLMLATGAVISLGLLSVGSSVPAVLPAIGLVRRGVWRSEHGRTSDVRFSFAILIQRHWAENP